MPNASKSTIFTQASNSSQLIEAIAHLNPEFKLLALNQKRPLQDSWQEDLVTRDQLIKDIDQGIDKVSKKNNKYKAYPDGIGLLTGEASGYILALDQDGESAGDVLNHLFARNEYSFNSRIASSMQTVAVTSGKIGHAQYLFRVPEKHRDLFKEFTRISLNKIGDFSCDTGEQIEFRYNCCQTVLPPSLHPETTGYRWVTNCSPDQIEIAELPPFLVKLILNKVRRSKREADYQKTNSKDIKVPTPKDIKPFDILTGLGDSNHNNLLKGCGEGKRNTIGFEIACDLYAVETYCHERGIPTKGDPEQLLLEFFDRCDPPYLEYEKVWESAISQPRKPYVGYEALHKILEDHFGFIDSSNLTDTQLELLKQDCIHAINNSRDEGDLYQKSLALSVKYGLNVFNISKYIDILTKQIASDEELDLFGREAFLAQKQGNELRVDPENLFDDDSLLPSLITDLAESIGSNFENIFTHLLPIWGSLLGSKMFLTIKKSSSWRAYPNFYSACVGKSGDGKSHMLSTAAKVLSRMQGRVFRDYEKDKEYLEQLAETDPKKARKTKPKDYKTYFFENTTTEALIAGLCENNKVGKAGSIQIKDELTGFFNAQNQYKGKGDDKEIFLQMFNNDAIHNSRKGDKNRSFVEKTVHSLTGGVQWGALDKLIAANGHDDDQGVMARFLFCGLPLSPKAPKLYEDLMAGNADINPYTRFQAFQDDIADYFENRVEAQEFFLSPKAALIADHWIENKIEIQENCAVKSLELYYPKLRIYCFRFALMLHLLEGYENEDFGGNAPDISPETMIRAIYLTEFYEKQYRHIVFRNHETTGDYLKVKSVIERRAKQGFESTLGDLRNYSRVVKGMTKTRLNQVIQYLIKVGQIFEIEGARTSRYTTIDPNKSTKDKYSIDNNEQLKTAGVTTSEEPTEENILSNLDTFKVSMLKEADISLAEQKDYSETIAKNKAFQDKFNKRFKPKARKPELTQEEYNDKRDKEFALQEVYNVKNLQKPKDITENVDSQPNQNKAKKKKKKSFGDL